MDKLVAIVFGGLLGFGAGWMTCASKCSDVVDRGLRIDHRGKPLAGISKRRRKSRR